MCTWCGCGCLHCVRVLTSCTYLSRSRVHHRGRPDGKHSPGRVKHALVKHSLVLLHTHVQRHVVSLGPSSQRRQPQHRVLVSSLHELWVVVCCVNEEMVSD